MQAFGKAFKGFATSNPGKLIGGCSVGAVIVGVCHQVFEERKTLFAKHYFKSRINQPVEAYGLVFPSVHNSRLCNDIAKVCTDEQCGGWVLWLPKDSGKTTYVRHVAQNLQQRGSKVVVLQPDFGQPPREWFAKALCLEKGGMLEMNQYLNGKDKLIIFIDQIDDPLNQELAPWFAELAILSRNFKKFVVVASVASPELACRLLRENGRKIKLVGDPALYLWEPAEVHAFVSKSTTDRKIILTEEQEQKVIAAGIRSHSVGLVMYMLSNPKLINHHHDVTAPKYEEYYSNWSKIVNQEALDVSLGPLPTNVEL